MAATGTLITALAWETSDSESPTRAEFQANWGALDLHVHDNRTKGGGVWAIQSGRVPTQTGDVGLSGDALTWWGTTAGAVKTAADLNSTQTLTNKTLTGPVVGSGGLVVHGNTASAAIATDGGLNLPDLLMGTSFVLQKRSSLTAFVGFNTYDNGSNSVALTTNKSVRMFSDLSSGTLNIDGAPSVSAGSAQTFTQIGSFTQGGGLQLGATAPTGGDKGQGTINVAGGYYVNGVAVPTGSTLTTASNVLGSDVALSNTASYFDGPSMAQGTSGTWLVVATVTVTDTAAGTQTFFAKLWDGTTVIASTGVMFQPSGPLGTTISLHGIITNPAGNIRVSVRDTSTTSGVIKFNVTGNSKDSSIWGVRIA